MLIRLHFFYQMKNILLALASIATAFTTFSFLMSSCTYLEPFVNACGNDVKSTGHSWAPVLSFFLPDSYIFGIDHFLCFITPFFDAVLDSGSFGKASFLFVAGPLMAIYVYTSVESTRQG